MAFFMILFFIFSIVITIYLRFPQFKIIKEIKKTKNKKTIQTFLLGLATNIGVGNLIGVSASIYYGGPGVIFWMAIFAFFASSFSYLETIYAISSKNTISSICSTSLVFKKYLPSKIGGLLAILFAVFLILSNSIFFPPIQIFAITSIMNKSFKYLFSFCLLLFIFIVTNKGIKRILKVTDILMPFIGVLYTITLIFLIIINIDKLKDTINLIIIDAFKIKSFSIASFLITFNVGISKSLFSNEAGLGTMPSLIGVADKKEVKQLAAFQMFSVIIDTTILCSLTGIYILMITKGKIDVEVGMLISYCMEYSLGNFGLVLSKIFIYCFGLASILGQYYLGECNALFLNKRVFKNCFKVLFYFGLILGIFSDFSRINSFLDIGMIILGLVNLSVLISIELRKKLSKNT